LKKKERDKEYIRYYTIADITIKVSSDLPLIESAFHPKFRVFKAKGPGEDMISIHHSFGLPELENQDLGHIVYDKLPWKIYEKKDGWLYIGTYPGQEEEKIFKIARFNPSHTKGHIFHEDKKLLESGNMTSLTFFPSDQILLARLLPDRGGCILHSAGLIYKGSGLAFAGHSEAGKSTMVKIFKDRSEILCDDRNIIRKKPGHGFYLYGTWSHGDIPDVSASRAKLKALFFLNKSKENRIERIEDRREITTRILDCIVKPLVTPDWWDKMITLAHDISRDIPCYDLYFNKQDGITDVIDGVLSKT
jgi:hypothetical protein